MKKWVVLLLGVVVLFSSCVVADSDPNLVGWWKFDDLGVSYAVDSSGYGNDGVLQGDAVKSTWAFDKALMVYDDGDCVEIAHDDIFNFTDKMTLMAWVRMAADEADMKIISKGEAFCFGRDYDNEFLVVSCDGLGRPMGGSMSVCDYEWHHVAVVYDGAELAIYVDGQLDRSKAATGTITPNSDSLLIGDKAGVVGLEWSGNIDDVRVYDRALTADEIRLFYYPFDINEDNLIDIFDVKLLAERWLGDGGVTTADGNGDGVVNFLDYRGVANNFDERVPPVEPKYKSLATVERGIPQPLEGHPGNIFLEGETVVIEVPSAGSSAVSWEVIDDYNQVVAYGDMPEVSIEGLGIGWYWISFLDSSDEEIAHTTATVLAELRAPVPQDSPVCVDMATAWFYDNTADWQTYASTAALAGVNVIRDRLRWREMEPSKEVFTTDYTKYDETADIQTAMGLKVLQVFHDKPSWSPVYREACPEDLRDLYTFCKEMAVRFKGRVHAWEPWNEGNCSTFGSMTIDELISLQKAAYLGFKAGEPETVVCWNAYSGGFDEIHIMGTLKNEAWSYYDTYNAHTYGCVEQYNGKFDGLRRAACGKPIWITEAERGGIEEIGPGPWYDMDVEHESLRAEFMAQSYATAVYSGVNRHFFFILGEYSSYPRLLRLDFTPRAAYTALAAVGRFMAGAKPIGRIYEADEATEKCHVYAFEAEPDGVKSDVLVCWAEDKCSWDGRGVAVVDWPITQQLEVRAIYDYLGRYIGTDIPAQLVGKPIFIVLEPGEADKVTWERQDHFGERPDKPYPVMLQLKMPRSTTVNGGELWTSVAEHVIAADTPRDIDIWAYNFSDTAVTGQVVVEEIDLRFSLSPGTWDVNIPAMGRVQLPATAMIPENPEKIEKDENWFVLKGNFSDGSKPALAFRLLDHWEKDE